MTSRLSIAIASACGRTMFSHDGAVLHTRDLGGGAVDEPEALRDCLRGQVDGIRGIVTCGAGRIIDVRNAMPIAAVR